MPIGKYSATAPALGDGENAPFQINSAGSLKVSNDPSGGASSTWNYAAASGGIVNSTAGVTIKAAAGAGLRNYLGTLTLNHDALGAATELVIRDGAAGTVLWRSKLQTAAADIALGSGSITFNPPLKSSANTLLEVACITAVTGGIFVNATGWIGS